MQQPPAATWGPGPQESDVSRKTPAKRESRKDKAAARRRSSASQVSSSVPSPDKDALSGAEESVKRRASFLTEQESKVESKETTNVAEKHDDVHFDELLVTEARRSSLKSPRKSSLKRKSSVEPVAAVVDEPTKRKPKNADENENALGKEIVSPSSPPEGSAEVATEKTEKKTKKDKEEGFKEREYRVYIACISYISDFSGRNERGAS
ncbi:hypothetical protein HPB50_001137 [Hyalomma asiaticum]|uniref:Uncharacterized protein n=1 Tax=Hyalomma asiaticum TaxID=266040 RepID=A0ACB7SNX6_HYAAI|nr:hypothetical protein HPB50_001137 [Hyalomma asiaticum]